MEQSPNNSRHDLLTCLLDALLQRTKSFASRGCACISLRNSVPSPEPAAERQDGQDRRHSRQPGYPKTAARDHLLYLALSTMAPYCTTPRTTTIHAQSEPGQRNLHPCNKRCLVHPLHFFAGSRHECKVWLLDDPLRCLTDRCPSVEFQLWITVIIFPEGQPCLTGLIKSECPSHKPTEQTNTCTAPQGHTNVGAKVATLSGARCRES